MYIFIQATTVRVTIMQTAVGKWGNSLGLRLPKGVVEDAKLSEGDTMDIRVQDGVVIMKPSRPRYRLEDLMADFRPEHSHGEIDTGKPVGEEVW